MYVGRSLVYEDCQRDVDVRIGARVLEDLQAPLGVVFKSSAWFVATMAEGFEQSVENAFQQLHSGTGEVGFDRLVAHNRTLESAATNVFFATLSELDRRWRDLCRGQFQLVLGEIHTAFNSISSRVFASQHPHPDKLVKWTEMDLAHPRINRGLGDYDTGQLTHGESLSALDYEMAFGRTASWRSPDKVLKPGDLVVRKTSAGLVATTKDGRKRFHIRETFPMFIGGLCINQFALFGKSAYLPRILLDDLIIVRERWCFRCADLAFATEATVDARFIAGYRWAKSLALPRWVFLSVPFETKPIYVDLESPLSLDVASAFIRRGIEKNPDTPVTITEMLPTPEQCWLTDVKGNRYTCELRTIALTSQRWKPLETVTTTGTPK